MHILLVDDDPAFLATMAKVLGQSGYRITTAEHFSTALSVLEDTDNKPDLLVADIVMPHSVNGVALAKMARLRHPMIPTVYLTGYDVPGIDEQLYGPLLRKPIEPEQLIAAIETEFVRRAGTTEDARAGCRGSGPNDERLADLRHLTGSGDDVLSL